MIDRTNATFILKVIAVSIFVGALTPVLFAGGYDSPFDGVVAGATGLIIGSGCLVVEMSFLSNQSIRWLRQIPLIVIIGFRAVAYSIIIVAGLIFPALVLLGKKFWLEPDFLFYFLLSAAIAFVISTAVELFRLLGREATLAIFTGHYRRPRQENRIVLFADLIGSTALAERLGELKFHEFLSDVYYDLSQTIKQNRGEVHRYVGDAVIITWPMTDLKSYERSVSCAEGMLFALDRKTKEYTARYETAARIRIALHCGPVAAGEIGTWKKEIALLGDTMNTAARIENAARDLGVSVVISEGVKKNLSADKVRRISKLPGYTARGKDKNLALWTITE